MSRTVVSSPRRSGTAVSSRNSETPDRNPRLYSTKNDLPESARIEAIGLLNQRLADCIDLQTQCKQAHWNVKGPSFIALHKLFDEINEAVEEYVDLLAERVVQLGGIAEGTVGIVAKRSTLLDYPLVLSTGEEHVAALSEALADVRPDGPARHRGDERARGRRQRRHPDGDLPRGGQVALVRRGPPAGWERDALSGDEVRSRAPGRDAGGNGAGRRH